MKFNFRIAALGVLLAALACRPRPEPRPVPVLGEDGSDVQRLVAVLDYMAGDYPRAVQNGHAVSDAEFEEQLRFAQDARGLAAAALRAREHTADPAGDP